MDQFDDKIYFIVCTKTSFKLFIICVCHDSATRKMVDGGDICVTFCRGQGGTPADEPVRDWPDSWQSVAVASYQDLVLREIWPFDIKEYPQYKSTGFRYLIYIIIGFVLI